MMYDENEIHHRQQASPGDVGDGDGDGDGRVDVRRRRNEVQKKGSDNNNNGRTKTTTNFISYYHYVFWWFLVTIIALLTLTLSHSNNNKHIPPYAVAATTTAAASSSSTCSSSNTCANSNSNTLSDGRVHELGYHNFESVLGSSSFTLILFHDRHDVSSSRSSSSTKTTKTTTEQKLDIIHKLANEYSNVVPKAFFLRNLNITFATVDTRQHHHIRSEYPPNDSSVGLGKAYDTYYKDYDKLMEDHGNGRVCEGMVDGMINSTTFMKLSHDQLPKLPSWFMLFYGVDYNVLDLIDNETTIELVMSSSSSSSEPNATVVADDTNYDFVRAWLGRIIGEHVHYAMEGVHQPRLSFAESKYQPEAHLRSNINYEKEMQAKYEKSDPMSTIDWEKADKMSYIIRKRRTRKNNKENDFNPDLFQVSIDDQSGESFYKYAMMDETDDVLDCEIMDSLGLTIELYLARADSYENLWDEERKALVDVQTNYGYYLERMNEQVKDVIYSVFDDISMNGINNPLLGPLKVPKLQKYYDDMIFGYGRSPTALNKYLHDFVYSPGGGSIDLFERIREYMAVREDVSRERLIVEGKEGNETTTTTDKKRLGNEKRYNMYFKTLWIKLNAVVAEFQTNLSRYYTTSYQKKAHVEQDDENQSRHSFKTLDVIDMLDQDNFDLLSDYDEFERQYISQRKSVILSNAKLTHPFNYTLEFLVEKCGFVDVTSYVQKSYRVGDISKESWGGLSKYTLPEELMAGKRLDANDGENNDYADSYDEEEGENDDGEGNTKTRISLEQFVALSKRFDDLYLHDYSIVDYCGALASFKTMYNSPKNQYFRIPAVIGQYDLIQKVAYSGYSNSWPSLFVGRKGSNSKLHIDNGATGFWMYLIKGKKRWITYDPAERPFLYERFDKHSFIADVLALNCTSNETERKIIHDYYDATYPLLNLASSSSEGGGGGYEIVQEVDQLLYIPPNTPHAVENLEDSIGLAFNLVPRAGVANHIHDLIHDGTNLASLEIILRYLVSEDEGRSSLASSEDPLYVTLGEYVAQY